MASVLQRYSVAGSKDKGPHAYNSSAWANRPLAPTSIAYAGNDVQIIRMLLKKMRKVNLSAALISAVQTHSVRYEGAFRNRTNEVSRMRQKVLVMEEHGILDQADLPADHPRQIPNTHICGRGYWEQAVSGLRSKNPSPPLFDKVLTVLQHDDWYTKAAFPHIRQLAAAYPHFTAKQRAIICNPPKLSDYDDDY
jgi:hypothetical protein